MYSVSFESEKRDDFAEGSTITLREAVGASFNEKDTLCFAANGSSSCKKAFVCEIRGTSEKIRAMDDGVCGTKVVSTDDKLKVISVGPDYYFPDVTRVVVELC